MSLLGMSLVVGTQEAPRKPGLPGPTKNKKMQEFSWGRGSPLWLHIENSWGALNTTEAWVLAPEIYIELVLGAARPLDVEKLPSWC